jgi:hypothetical protein
MTTQMTSFLDCRLSAVGGVNKKQIRVRTGILPPADILVAFARATPRCDDAEMCAPP